MWRDLVSVTVDYFHCVMDLSSTLYCVLVQTWIYSQNHATVLHYGLCATEQFKHRLYRLSTIPGADIPDRWRWILLSVRILRKCVFNVTMPFNPHCLKCRQLHSIYSLQQVTYSVALYRNLPVGVNSVLCNFHLAVIEYLCRGRRAVPLQTFTILDIVLVNCP